MSKKPFVHLHTHTEYSLLDGANKISKLCEEVAKDNQKALAITDHGNLYGAIEFYTKCKEYNIKPIIGCEFYVSLESRFEKHNKFNPYSHITLLAENYEGYKNLLYLSSLSFIEGLSTRPRIDLPLLYKHSKGIICLSGCLSGRINQLILDHRNIDAISLAVSLNDVFGKDKFFLEIQRNGLYDQDIVTKDMLNIRKTTNIPIVATNDIHYLRQESCDIQDTLLCINTNSSKHDLDRFKLDCNTLYVKSQEEMNHIFKDINISIYNTNFIAEMCNLDLDIGSHNALKYMPKSTKYNIYDSYYNKAQKLDNDCRFAINYYYKDNNIKNVALDRLEYELQVITTKGLTDYFLIVSDYIDWARNNGIPVGPGRGSAAGSIVAYLLGITSIDPIKHNLLFERFLNPERKGIPDIDVDFCQERRDEVIEYLKKKYGYDKVSSIITFGTFGSKAAIRGVCRAYDFETATIDSVSKKFAADTIKESLETDKSLVEFSETYPHIVNTAMEIEGLVSYAGTHASGIIISDVPLTDIVPLCRNSKDGTITTQWDLDSCEKIGLVKFDILGLETLTVIDRCIKLILSRYTCEVPYDIDKSVSEFDDPNVYKLLSNSNTECVFQCYSDGMKRMLSDLKPSNFEDIMAAIALFRPGPIESGIFKKFIDRKHGIEPIEYISPSVEPYLKDTYGTMIYQEQIMHLARILSNFTNSEADDLRKAVGKKLPEELVKIKDKFVCQCILKEEQANNLWNDIVKFGRYGFNKSHSAAYAYLTYQTAWLKHYYPVEFYCSNLTQEAGNTNKFISILKDIKKTNIKVLPCDINNINNDCYIDKDNNIRLGLNILKGLGESFLNNIDIKIFKSSDIITALKSIPRKYIKKNNLEVLIAAGMLDNYLTSDIDRGILYNNASNILDYVDKLNKPRPKRVTKKSINYDAPSLKEALDMNKDFIWSKNTLLSYEKKVYNFYVSGHPMENYRLNVFKSGSCPIKYLKNTNKEIYSVKLLCLVSNIEIKSIKSGKNKGKKYAKILLEDHTDYINANLFSNIYDQNIELLEESDDKSIILEVYGKVIYVNNEPNLLIKLVKIANTSFEDKFILPVFDNIDFKDIRNILEKHKGSMQTVLNFKFDNPIKYPINYSINPNTELLEEIDRIYTKNLKT